MISWEEMLKGNKEEDIPKEHIENMKSLMAKLNKIRALYGKPMTLNSIYRSFRHHCEIYRDKGVITQEEMDDYIESYENEEKIYNCKIPSKSKHLCGFAADISDPDFELTKFCKEHQAEMEKIDVYFEDDQSVKRLHIQSVRPASGARWFKP